MEISPALYLFFIFTCLTASINFSSNTLHSQLCPLHTSNLLTFMNSSSRTHNFELYSSGNALVSVGATSCILLDNMDITVPLFTTSPFILFGHLLIRNISFNKHFYVPLSYSPSSSTVSSSSDIAFPTLKLTDSTFSCFEVCQTDSTFLWQCSESVHIRLLLQ